MTFPNLDIRKSALLRDAKHIKPGLAPGGNQLVSLNALYRSSTPPNAKLSTNETTTSSEYRALRATLNN